MKILINGEEREIPDNFFLGEILEYFELPAQRIAIELNRNVIRRSEWGEIRIAADDRIEIIHFVGGG